MTHPSRTLLFNSDNETRTVHAGTTIHTESWTVYSRYAASTLINEGTLISDTVNAVYFFSTPDGVVVNTKSGHIQAAGWGIFTFQSDGAVITNDGTITGGAGIAAFTSNNTIYNSGDIQSTSYGIEMIASANDVIHNSGNIHSGTVGIAIDGYFGLVFDQTKTTVIDNSGLISGDTASVQYWLQWPDPGGVDVENSGKMIGDIDLRADAGSSQVHNSGIVRGDVLFGKHGDLFVETAGKVTGAVEGGSGRDTLDGGPGADRLDGGAGVDQLSGGGGGADIFRYDSIADSAAGGTARGDKIGGWTGSERFDLSALDADSHTAGVQHLVFGGEVEAGAALTPGRVEDYHQGHKTFVVADVDGDGHADFLVRIVGAVELTEANFIL